MRERTVRFLRITFALLMKEVRQHFTFFLSYIGICLVLLLLGFRFNFIFMMYLAIPAVPFFLGVQVFGLELSEGTSTFTASLPARPSHLWFVKVLFGLMVALMLVTVLSISFLAASGSNSQPSPESETLEPNDALFWRIAILYGILIVFCFSCAAYCTHLLRRPLPAVLLSISMGVGTFFLFGWLIFQLKYPDIWADVVFTIYATVLVGTSYAVFTRGRGHLGFPGDRWIAGLTGFLSPLAIAFILRLIRGEP